VPVLQIDIEPVDTDGSVAVVAEVVGDLDTSIARLNAMAPAENEWSEAEIAQHRDAFQNSLRLPSDAFTPDQAIDLVRAALPRDGILSFDVGAHTHQIASQWPAHAPRSFLITNGWSSMGFGLPGAIAAKLAAPDRPVVCMLGDGCFQMTCGELATAARLGLALPVVVLNDSWLSLIQIKQMRRQYSVYGTALEDKPSGETPPHYFGVPAVGATNPDDFRDALATAFATEGPMVVEAHVDPTNYMETVFD
ncbi:MAG: thiamine pyrophosphate-dependent enzyme, partial [Alphaproteobacteria bacterium]|nr:thiamine pyrophosphate-dependent enzyme [Alphaproteobacteria bacterium]